MKKILGLIFATILLSSCGSSIEEISSGRPHSSVATTEKDGVVSGDVKKDGGSQTIVAGDGTAIPESSVNFPAGSLVLDATVSMKKGSDLTSTLLGDLGMSGSTVVAVQGAPVLVSSSNDAALTGAYTLSLPVPIPDQPLSLTTTAGKSKISILYLWKGAGSNHVGLTTVDQSNFRGTFVKLDFKNFGWFRLVAFTSTVTDKDVTTNRAPQ